jgi:acyl-CoA hydrolase
MAAMIGESPFFLEVNRRMPRTFGENQVHISQIAGWCEADYPLAELTPHPMREIDSRLLEYVAERIPDGATLQIGIGVLPNEVLGMLGGHTDLGVHSELFAEGFVDLVERGGVTGSRKLTHRNKIVTTTAIGSQRLYDLVDENPGVEFWPVNYTNDPENIAKEDRMVAINATLEVDFLGQCASEPSAATTDLPRAASLTSRGGRCSPSMVGLLSCCTRRRPTRWSHASSPICIPAPRSPRSRTSSTAS